MEKFKTFKEWNSTIGDENILTENAGFFLFADALKEMVASGTITYFQSVLIYLLATLGPLSILFYFLGGQQKLKMKIKDIRDKIRFNKEMKNLDEEEIKKVAKEADAAVQKLSPGKRRFLKSLVNKMKGAGLKDRSTALKAKKEIEKYIEKEQKD